MNAISPISAVTAVNSSAPLDRIARAPSSRHQLGRRQQRRRRHRRRNPGAGRLVPQLAKRRLQQPEQQLTSADTAVADFASGGSADLHTVMLQMEEASISLKAATDVQSKLLEAYQDIMRTQV